MSLSIKDLEDQVEELDKEYKKLSQRKWKFRITAVLFLLFSFFLMTRIENEKKSVKERILKSYLQQTDEKSLKEIYDIPILRGNPKAFEWYEKNELGIPNNTALAGISWNCEGNTSFRNEIGDLIAFQDKKTKVLIVEIAGKKVHVGKTKVGEIIATHNKIFYIDKDNFDSLYVFNIESSSVQKLIETPISQFALYGEYIFFLDKDEKIIRYSLNNGKQDMVADNIQRFFLSGDIIAQNERQIIQIKLSDYSYSIVLEDAFLLGADTQFIYFSNFGITPTIMKSALDESNDSVVARPDVDLSMDYIVCAIDKDMKEITIMGSSNAFIRAVYLTDDNVFLDLIN